MNKTGTSTLKHCFLALGWEPVASPKTVPHTRRMTLEILEREDYSKALAMVPHFAAFEDRPWNVWEMYRHVDEAFPDSRFVLTVRSPETWWRSVENWLQHKKPQMVELYTRHLRAETFSRESFLAGYARHNAAIRSWFAGTGKLLVVDVEAQHRWDELCAFLDVPVPDLPFPHANQQKYRD
jgi:hypothetical protein